MLLMFPTFSPTFAAHTFQASWRRWPAWHPIGGLKRPSVSHTFTHTCFPHFAGIMEEMASMGIHAIGGPQHADAKVDVNTGDPHMEVDKEVRNRGRLAGHSFERTRVAGRAAV